MLRSIKCYEMLGPLVDGIDQEVNSVLFLFLSITLGGLGHLGIRVQHAGK